MNKKFAPQYLKVKEVDRENFRIRFVFSSGIVDRHGEVIDQKGWKLDNYLKNPVVLWGHDQSKFPIGRTENMSNIGQLEGDVIFAYNENPEAAIAFELCAGGFLSAGSVGFMNLKWMYDEEKDLLTLLENELFEFSIVNVPANPEAIAKAIGEMESKNVDKKVIANVKAFGEKAKQNLADRFKDLGEEAKPEDEDEEEGPKPEIKPEEEKPEESPAAGDSNAPEADEPTEEEVKAALDVLFKSKREVITASVKELSSRLNDAKEDKKDSQVEATPSQKGLKKGLSNRHINSLVRSLLNSKS